MSVFLCDDCENRFDSNAEPIHESPAELQETIDEILPLVERLGTLRIEEAMREIERRVMSGEIEFAS